jgi:regulator of sigma E protease
MILTVVSFVLVMGLIVFVHELGHFLVAKRSGIVVEEFGFG